MMNGTQLREFIIKPALSDLVMLSDDAVELLMFTCATESNGGEFLVQLHGPALGIFQMEPATHNDIWTNYINNKMSLCSIMVSNFDCIRMPAEDRLIYDLRYAAAMARLHYARFPEKLPMHTDLIGIWEYYKKYYNAGGKASHHESIQKYQSLISL